MKTWTFHHESGFWSPVAHLELSETVHFKDAMAWGHRTLIIEEGNCDHKEFITWDSYFTEEKVGKVLKETVSLWNWSK